jgi:hypothetical protein
MDQSDFFDPALRLKTISATNIDEVILSLAFL